MRLALTDGEVEEVGQVGGHTARDQRRERPPSTAQRQHGGGVTDGERHGPASLAPPSTLARRLLTPAGRDRPTAPYTRAMADGRHDSDLTPRQQLVLRKVVRTYQATALPVGSKLLASDEEIGAGPSTIRNELAWLEGRGLLDHPHTSAGRVPTERACATSSTT